MINDDNSTKSKRVINKKEKVVKSVKKTKSTKKKVEKKSVALFEAPFLSIPNVIIFPYTLSPLELTDKDTIAALEDAMIGDKLVCVFPEVPKANDALSEMVNSTLVTPESMTLNGKSISKIGTACRIVKKLRFPDDSVRLLLRGLKRIEAVKVMDADPPP